MSDLFSHPPADPLRAQFSMREVPAYRVIGSRERVMKEDFGFWSARRQKWYVAPKGFRYNGPSFLVIVGGDGEAGSCIHDWMYSCPDLYTRADADLVLRECLECEGMGSIRRNGWWAGVRACGWRHFGREKYNHEENDQPLDPSPGA